VAYRNIVFVGNCQAIALWRLYRDCLAEPGATRVSHVNPRATLGPSDRKTLAEADLVTVQDYDLFPFTEYVGIIRRDATVIHYPVVMCGFLWPFAGRARHPKNRGYSFFGPGPFNVPMGDGFLNRLIRKGVSADEAVERYLSLDFNKVTSLNRLYEHTINTQRARDAKTGFSFADTIERFFRSESLFMDVGHVRLTVFRVMARQLYAAMGVSETTIENALANLINSPFPAAREMPIHPAIGRHFGLPYATETATYQFLYEGRVTFDEYVRRYMRYQWNQDLHEGIWLATRRDDDRALALLDSGLRRSPESSIGHRARSEVLARRRRYEDALADAKRAAELDPNEPKNQLSLARVEFLADHPASALSNASRAINRFPRYAPIHQLLAEIHWAAGRRAEAVSSARRAMELRPGDPGGQYQLGRFLMTQGDFAAAEKAFKNAIFLGFAAPASGIALARAIVQQGRLGEATDQAISVVTLAPGDRSSLNLVDQFLREFVARNWNLSQAELVARAVIDLAPKFAPFRRTLADILYRRTQYRDAEKICRTAMELDAGHATDHLQLSLILFKLGNLPKAEMEIRRAIALDPLHAAGAAWAVLGNVVAAQGRRRDAIEYVRKAVELSPKWARQLASLLLLEKRVAEAEKIVTEGLRANPNDKALLLLRGRIAGSPAISQMAGATQ
jgi:tetratricopeptide (TPR) repeat protein